MIRTLIQLAITVCVCVAVYGLMRPLQDIYPEVGFFIGWFSALGAVFICFILYTIGELP